MRQTRKNRHKGGRQHETLEKVGLGFLSGIEGIWDFAAGGLAKLFGADDWAEQQIANDWVLGFFRKARADYQSDEKLTGAAARLYRQYKKLFDEFSARNQRYLGVENASEQARKYVGDKHFALKTYSEKQKENWKNSKNIVIYESSEQLQEFVRQSRSDNQYSKKMYFGAIGSELAARIEEQTGLNLENYNYALRSDEVRKIFKDHGTVGTEAPRGQRPVTEADFLAIPDILDGATSITLSEKKYNGQPAIAFSKVSGNERTTVVAVVSGKHLDLRVQTEYIGIKKGTLATLSGEQAPNNTPKASRGTDSTNSISQNAENVNSESQKGKKFALPDTDSDGGKLTAEQREFFGKSAIVDADGKLLKMYHGTAADFTVFDIAESGASNDHTSHIGFWFTPRKAVAENFAEFNANDYQGKKARVQEVYLNIENPKIYAPTDNSARMEELRTENTRLREQLTEEYAELKETVGRLNYMSIPASVVLAVVVAAMLNSKIKGERFFKTAFYVPSVTVSVAIAAMWTFMLDPMYGMINQLLGTNIDFLGQTSTALPTLALMSVWGGLGYNVLIVLSAMKNIDASLYEAAEMDGAGSGRRFISVTVPSILPTIFFIVITSVIGGFQAFDQMFLICD